MRGERGGERKEEKEREREEKRETIIMCVPRIVCSCTLCSFSVEAIEVMDTVVVSAFGRPIPVMKPR